MVYTPKTGITDQSVDDFLETVGEKRRDEAYKLIEVMRRATGEEPRMWGPSIVGFGKFHYVTKSKSEADWFKVGFSPRKAKISLYVSHDADEFADELAKLGKHTRGKGCVYVNKLEDINTGVLEEIIRSAYKNTRDFNASK